MTPAEKKRYWQSLQNARHRLARKVGRLEINTPTARMLVALQTEQAAQAEAEACEAQARRERENASLRRAVMGDLRGLPYWLDDWAALLPSNIDRQQPVAVVGGKVWR